MIYFNLNKHRLLKTLMMRENLSFCQYQYLAATLLRGSSHSSQAINRMMSQRSPAKHDKWSWMNVKVPKLHWSQESTWVAKPYVTPYTRMQTTVCQTREEEKDDLNNTLKIIFKYVKLNRYATCRPRVRRDGSHSSRTRASLLHSVPFQRLPSHELICELCTMSDEREQMLIRNQEDLQNHSPKLLYQHSAHDCKAEKHTTPYPPRWF